MVDDGVRGLRSPLYVGAEVSSSADQAFALPTGTVTFLSADVGGGLQLWQEAPDARTAAVARHVDLLEEAIVGHGGVRPVEPLDVGNVVGAFSRAADALAAAVAAQRAVAAEQWPAGAAVRVRMGLHTGEAQLRGERAYFGDALDRATRIRAVGHGGQVLLSAATATLAADRLPAA